MSSNRVKGTVKWFDKKKGFGFVLTEGDDRDIFVHYSEIQRKGFRYLKEGQDVEFELRERDKGPYAVEVEILRGDN